MSNQIPNEARWLAKKLADLEKLQKASHIAPRLAHSSVEEGGLKVTDSDGNVVDVLGPKPQEGQIIIPGREPSKPSTPVVTAYLGTATTVWDGTYTEEYVAPDLKHLEVHASTDDEFEPTSATVIGTITNRSGGSSTAALDYGTWFFRLIAVSASEARSEPSDIASAEVIPLVEAPDMQEVLADIDARYDGVITEAGQLGERLEQAQTELQEHATRIEQSESDLNNLSSVTLPGLKTDLDKAKTDLTKLDTDLGSAKTTLNATKQDVDTLKNTTLPGLKTDISSAQTRLDTAEAGITDSKGRLDKAEEDLTSAFGQLGTVDSRINTAKTQAAADAQEKADAAQAAAISAAATTAQLKADGAKADAIAAAELKAKQLADAAQKAALDAAKLDAQEKADAAKQAAITSAASDAQAKADAVRIVANKAVEDAQKVRQEAISRGTDLVTNGTGLLGDNTNFKSSVFLQGDQPPGTSGTFSTPNQSSSFATEELIPVDVNKKYAASVWVKQANEGVSARFYLYLAPYDAEKLSIQPYHYMEQTGTRTTLAADLKPGDTKVVLTSANKWNNSAGASNHLRTIVFWNYIDGLGKRWKAGEYSRNVLSNSYDDGGISGNTISLRTPYTGNLVPAGTEVSNGSSGGNYLYPVGNALDSPEWKNYPGVYLMGGIHTDNSSSATKNFPIASSFMKVGVLTNRNASGGNSRQLFAGISFSDVTANSRLVEEADAKALAAQTAADKAISDAATAHSAAGSAQTTADNALTMAGSKSKVYYSTANPSGTASVGDTWRKVDASNNVIAEWRWTDKNVWTPQQITSEVISNLDVGKLTAGSAIIQTAVINKIAAQSASIIELDASRITTGKLGAARIDVADLAAEVATVIKLNASSIIAGTIDTGRLNASEIAAAVANIIQLNADRITAGIINTDRLNTNEIAARVATVIQLNADRITAGTIDTDRLNAVEIAAKTAAFQEVDIKNLFVTTGTMSEAVINKLWTDVVHSRKITANMIAIGSFDNLIPGGDFSERDNWDGNSRLTIVGGQSESGGPVGRMAGKGSTSSSYANFPNGSIPCIPGMSYRLRAKVRSSVNTPSNSIRLLTRFTFEDGTYTWPTISTPAMTAGQWVLIEGVVKVPEKAVGITFALNVQSSLPDGAFADFADVSAMRMSGGELIVDGAVTAEKIAANAVEADKLAANAVTADKIRAGAIDGKTITGALIQTHKETEKGIKISNEGILAYDSEGSQTMQITPGSGVDYMGFFGKPIHRDQYMTNDGWMFSSVSGENYVFFRPRIDGDPFSIGTNVRFTFDAYYSVDPDNATTTSLPVTANVWGYPQNTWGDTLGNKRNISSTFTIDTTPRTYDVTVNITQLPTPFMSWIAGLQPADGSAYDATVIQDRVGIRNIKAYIDGEEIDLNPRQQLAGIDQAGEVSGQNLNMAGTSRLEGPVIMNGDPIEGHGSGDHGPVIMGRDLLGATYVDFFESHPSSGGAGWLTPMPHGLLSNSYENGWNGTNDNKWTMSGKPGGIQNMVHIQDTVEIKNGRGYLITYTAPAFKATDGNAGSPGASVVTYTTGRTIGIGTGKALHGSRYYFSGGPDLDNPGRTVYAVGGQDLPVGDVTLGVEVYVYDNRTIESTGTADARYWSLNVLDVGAAIKGNTGNSTRITRTRPVDTTKPPVDSPPPPPKPPAKKTYTNTWNASWWGTWWVGNGNGRNSGLDKDGKAAQGKPPGVGYRQRGAVGFPSMTSTLSGSTVKKVEVYVYAAHWYSSAGGTLQIGTHGHTSKPGTWSGGTTGVKNQKLAKPEGRWITLPTSVHAGVKSGSIRGIQVYTSSTGSSYYGYLTGSKTKIRVTYEK